MVKKILIFISLKNIMQKNALVEEKCVELNKGIIILEDDAIIKPNFSEIYHFTSSPENHFEFFWLSTPALERRNQKSKAILTINQHNTLSEFYAG